MFWLTVIGTAALFALICLIAIKTSLSVSCPSCPNSVIIPIIPGYKAWCPGCETIYDHADLSFHETHDKSGYADDETELVKSHTEEAAVDEFSFDDEMYGETGGEPEKNSSGPPTF